MGIKDKIGSTFKRVARLDDEGGYRTRIFR